MSEAIIQVILHLLPTVSGYRASGWRALCNFHGVMEIDGAEVFGVEVRLAGEDKIEPGEAAACELRLWAADALPGPVEPGTTFRLMEGTQDVATGQVTSFREVVE